MHKYTFSKLNKLLKQLPYLPQALSLVWQVASRWTVAWAALLIAQGLLPVASVYLIRAVVDSLVAALESGGNWETIKPTLILVGLMAAVLLLSGILRSITTWVRTAQGELVSAHISGLIHEKAISLDLGFFETPTFYDQLHRARVDAISRPVALLESIGSLVQNGITLLAMAAVLLSFGIWLPVVLAISTLPALFVVVRYTQRFHLWREKNTTNERRSRYYDGMITWHKSAAEIRLFSLGDHFKTAFQDLRARLLSGRVQLAKEQALAELAAGSVALLAMGAVMGWMVWQAVQGLVSLGDVALFYQAFNQGQRLMRSLLANAGEIYRNFFFLENLFEFLALESQVISPPMEESRPMKPQGDIVIERVSFQYPHSQRLALNDLELTIPNGQIVAIVGQNGAGKSTLIKLLCRFYDPQAGSIRFGGTDIREYLLKDLRRQITVLFQEPVHYHERVSDNIAYGDLLAEPGLKQIEAAALAAGADKTINKLSKSYETVLGKWFGGDELSVGEWQRIALARAFMRQASLIILDEPTSAMDSWAEADWISRFRKLVDGRMALIITHRFTTAMQADVIHVMENGQILESGSHGELMALKGRYAQSWLQQIREV